jgi:hypothetical protein
MNAWRPMPDPKKGALESGRRTGMGVARVRGEKKHGPEPRLRFRPDVPQWVMPTLKPM